MTRVDFHLNVPDKLHHACRLSRKAVAQGARLLLLTTPDEIYRLDQLLWTFTDLDFLPHRRTAAQTTGWDGVTPIVLACDADARQPAWLESHPVLVNLRPEIPPLWQQAERVIEIVPADQAQRQPARTRWRQYASAGVSPAHFDLSAQAA